MNPAENYLEINRKLWNERAKIHFESPFYDLPGFLNGENSLKPIELELLGDLKGKSLLHLQCHFGQDTLSLARLGAEVTGVDLSDEAIARARQLSDQLQLSAGFICCDLYNLPSHLDHQFDIVFSSYGTIGWLPDLKAWASIIARYLKPGGRFVFAEFHPVIWMFDNAFSRIEYSYFNKQPIVELTQGTYADENAPLTLDSVGWNHSLDSVLQNLLDAGLQLTSFREFDYSPYDIFPDMVEVGPGRYRMRAFDDKLPYVFALSAIKPAV